MADAGAGKPGTLSGILASVKTRLQQAQGRDGGPAAPTSRRDGAKASARTAAAAASAAHATALELRTMPREQLVHLVMCALEERDAAAARLTEQLARGDPARLRTELERAHEQRDAAITAVAALRESVHARLGAGRRRGSVAESTASALGGWAADTHSSFTAAARSLLQPARGVMAAVEAGDGAALAVAAPSVGAADPRAATVAAAAPPPARALLASSRASSMMPAPDDDDALAPTCAQRLPVQALRLPGAESLAAVSAPAAACSSANDEALHSARSIGSLGCVGVVDDDADSGADPHEHAASDDASRAGIAAGLRHQPRGRGGGGSSSAGAGFGGDSALLEKLPSFVTSGSKARGVVDGASSVGGLRDGAVEGASVTAAAPPQHQYDDAFDDFGLVDSAIAPADTSASSSSSSTAAGLAVAASAAAGGSGAAEQEPYGSSSAVGPHGLPPVMEPYGCAPSAAPTAVVLQPTRSRASSFAGLLQPGRALLLPAASAASSASPPAPSSLQSSSGGQGGLFSPTRSRRGSLASSAIAMPGAAVGAATGLGCALGSLGVRGGGSSSTDASETQLSFSPARSGALPTQSLASFAAAAAAASPGPVEAAVATSASSEVQGGADAQPGGDAGGTSAAGSAQQQAVISSLSAELRYLSSELESARAALALAEVDAAQARLTAQLTLSQLQASYAKDVGELRADVARLRDAHAQLGVDAAQLRSKLSESAQKAAATKAEVAALRAESAQLKLAHWRLQREVGRVGGGDGGAGADDARVTGGWMGSGFAAEGHASSASLLALTLDEWVRQRALALQQQRSQQLLLQQRSARSRAGTAESDSGVAGVTASSTLSSSSPPQPPRPASRASVAAGGVAAPASPATSSVPMASLESFIGAGGAAEEGDAAAAPGAAPASHVSFAPVVAQPAAAVPSGSSGANSAGKWASTFTGFFSVGGAGSVPSAAPAPAVAAASSANSSSGAAVKRDARLLTDAARPQPEPPQPPLAAKRDRVPSLEDTLRLGLGSIGFGLSGRARQQPQPQRAQQTPSESSGSSGQPSDESSSSSGGGAVGAVGGVGGVGSSGGASSSGSSCPQVGDASIVAAAAAPILSSATGSATTAHGAPGTIDTTAPPGGAAASAFGRPLAPESRTSSVASLVSASQDAATPLPLPATRQLLRGREAAAAASVLDVGTASRDLRVDSAGTAGDAAAAAFGEEMGGGLLVSPLAIAAATPPPARLPLEWPVAIAPSALAAPAWLRRGGVVQSVLSGVRSASGRRLRGPARHRRRSQSVPLALETLPLRRRSANVPPRETGGGGPQPDATASPRTPRLFLSAALASAPLFASLSDDERALFAAAACKRAFVDAGGASCTPLIAAAALCVIEEGTALLLGPWAGDSPSRAAGAATSARAAARPLARLGPGACLSRDGLPPGTVAVAAGRGGSLQCGARGRHESAGASATRDALAGHQHSGSLTLLTASPRSLASTLGWFAGARALRSEHAAVVRARAAAAALQQATLSQRHFTAAGSGGSRGGALERAGASQQQQQQQPPPLPLSVATRLEAATARVQAGLSRADNIEAFTAVLRRHSEQLQRLPLEPARPYAHAKAALQAAVSALVSASLAEAGEGAAPASGPAGDGALRAAAALAAAARGLEGVIKRDVEQALRDFGREAAVTLDGVAYALGGGGSGGSGGGSRSPAESLPAFVRALAGTVRAALAAGGDARSARAGAANGVSPIAAICMDTANARSSGSSGGGESSGGCSSGGDSGSGSASGGGDCSGDGSGGAPSLDSAIATAVCAIVADVLVAASRTVTGGDSFTACHGLLGASCELAFLAAETSTQAPVEIFVSGGGGCGDYDGGGSGGRGVLLRIESVNAYRIVGSAPSGGGYVSVLGSPPYSSSSSGLYGGSPTFAGGGASGGSSSESGGGGAHAPASSLLHGARSGGGGALQVWALLRCVTRETVAYRLPHPAAALESGDTDTTTALDSSGVTSVLDSSDTATVLVEASGGRGDGAYAQGAAADSSRAPRLLPQVGGTAGVDGGGRAAEARSALISDSAAGDSAAAAAASAGGSASAVSTAAAPAPRPRRLVSMSVASDAVVSGGGGVSACDVAAAAGDEGAPLAHATLATLPGLLAAAAAQCELSRERLLHGAAARALEFGAVAAAAPPLMSQAVRTLDIAVHVLDEPV